MNIKLNSLIIFTLCIFMVTGCASLSHKNSNNNITPQEDSKTASDRAGFINEAKVYYASEIEDRGWQLEDYRMEGGDVLNVSVWQIPELEKTVVIRPDGKVSFPLIGDVQAKGATIEEVRMALEEKLSKYIRVPQVSVIVESFGGKRAIVIDESGGGGIIRFAEPIRIIEALAMAGGYSNDVNLHKIYVVRGGIIKGDEPKIIVVNAHKIFRQADMRENILIHSDDIIFLARGWLATLTDFVGQLDTLKTQIGKVISQANYYRNVDNIVPWNYKATDVDFSKDNPVTDRTTTSTAQKSDWGIGE